MPALFRLLCDEPDPAVRVVLGHLLFVYIHPYPDGNGRIGRFLMNLMLTAGGYPWTVIPVEHRDTDGGDRGCERRPRHRPVHRLSGRAGG